MTSDQLNLNGRWHCVLDPQDRGIEEEIWRGEHLLPCRATVQLPGTTDSNQLGPEDQHNVRDHHSRRYAHIGPAWFQRNFHIPENWIDKRIELHIERVMWSSRVYLNEKEVGSQDSLSTPHQYRIDPFVQHPKQNVLTLRIDNSELLPIGRPHAKEPIAHAYSDHTQSRWNGCIGEMYLKSRPHIGIQQWWIAPLDQSNCFRMRVELYNDQCVVEEVSLNCSAGEQNWSHQVQLKGHYLSDYTFDVRVSGDDSWDEFRPHLIPFDLEVKSSLGVDRQTKITGYRRWSVDDKEMLINGRPTFLRGTLECAIWPATGHPPMTPEPWIKMMKMLQAHGGNHLRFHSWCPPEAAFVAADQLGVYLQVEGPCWAYVGQNEEHDRYQFAEADKILRAYGHHPSFCFFVHGNEPSGLEQQVFLDRWLGQVKSDDGRLYCSASGWPRSEGSDYHVLMFADPDSRGFGKVPMRTHPWGIGMDSLLNRENAGTRIDYNEGMGMNDRPLVVHEVGQWCAYPNPDEIEKYQGPIKPENYQMIYEESIQAGCKARLSEYVKGSVHLQNLCYRAEIEAALATHGIAGMQLLSLQDFPGQGTAPVGVLDAFWEPKPGHEPGQFAKNWQMTQLLARFDTYNWNATDQCVVDIDLVHYGKENFTGSVQLEWALCAKDQEIESGRISLDHIQHGRQSNVTQLVFDCEKWPGNQSVSLVLRLTEDQREITESTWNLWAWSDQGIPPSEVILVDEWTEEIQEKLVNGAKVIYSPSRDQLPGVDTAFPPIFWNSVWTRGQAPYTMGLLIDHEHPAFDNFPTGPYQDWCWHDIVRGSRAFPLPPDADTALVEVIPDWNDPKPLALIQACQVEKGLLVIAGCRFNDLDQRPATRCLLSSLKQWMAEYDDNAEFNIELSDQIRDHLGLS